MNPAIKVDVCVIGTHVAGLLVAYLLARKGSSVLVVSGPVSEPFETVPLGSLLTVGLDWPLSEVVRLHSDQAAFHIIQRHLAAVEAVEHLCGVLGPHCGFERCDGYLVPVLGDPQDLLQKEQEAALKAGAPGVVVLPTGPPGMLGQERPCLRVPHQARIRLAPFLHALLEAVRREGGRVMSGRVVQEIRSEETSRIHLRSGDQVVAQSVVMTAPSSLDDLLEMHTRLGAYQVYRLGAMVPRGAMPRSVYADTLGRMAWLEEQPGEDHDLLVVSGESHKVGRGRNPEHHYQRLEAWARSYFPILGIQSRDSSQVLESTDRLGFVGRLPWAPTGVFIARGGAGGGIICQVVAAQVLIELVMGEAQDWVRLFEPGQKPGADDLAFPEDVQSLSWHYPEWMESSDLAKLAANRGAVVRQGDTVRAIYRDPSGDLCELSSWCPNVGAPVRWDPVVRCWNCPCHGQSRVFF